MGKFAATHTKSQKEMLRKRTSSGVEKAAKTGVSCNTFISYVFWNPTSQKLQGVGHLPEGMDLPDVNKFLREYFLGKRTLRSRTRNPRRQAEEIVVDTGHRAHSESEELAIHDEVLTDTHAIEVYCGSDIDEGHAYMANTEDGGFMTGQAASAGCPQTNLPSSFEPISDTTGHLPIGTDLEEQAPLMTPSAWYNPKGMPFEMRQGAALSRRESPARSSVLDSYLVNHRRFNRKIWDLLEEFRRIVRTV